MVAIYLFFSYCLWRYTNI